MEATAEDQSKTLDGSRSSNEKQDSSLKIDRSSPESSCVICLGKLENKSFTDSCFHQFCFTCLLEWSKVKAECPLCKQPFKSIIHNVRSIEDYDQYHLRPEESHNSWESPDGRRFRYRSTLTAERRCEIALERLLLGSVRRRSSFFYGSLWNQSRPHIASSEFRQTVYDQNWWALPIDQMQITPARIRNVSSSFFHANPACTHRLIPWLNRELIVLLRNRESQISFVMELVISLIQRYEILSPEFREHIRPYVLHRTDHFIHEFYNFARSPWDMVAYDHHVSYQNSSELHNGNRDNEIVVLSPTESNALDNPINLSLDNVISDSSDQNEINATNLNALNVCETSPNRVLGKVKKFLSNVSTSNNWDSPSTISFSPDWNSSIQTSPSAADQSRVLPSLSSPQPGPSGVNRSSVLVAESSESDSSNDDDCYIVGYVKPIKDRSPLIIDLVSDSDEESDKARIKVCHQSVKHKNPSADYSSSSSSKEREYHSLPRNDKNYSSKRSKGAKDYRSRSSSSSSYTRSTSDGRSSSYARSTSDGRSKSFSSKYVKYEKYSSRSKHYQRTRSRSRSCSPHHWRWTAYESGGGKLQRTFSSSEDLMSVKSPSKECPTNHSLRKKHNHTKHKHKKHKKHKHKHKSSHKEDKHKTHRT